MFAVLAELAKQKKEEHLPHSLAKPTPFFSVFRFFLPRCASMLPRLLQRSPYPTRSCSASETAAAYDAALVFSSPPLSALRCSALTLPSVLPLVHDTLFCASPLLCMPRACNQVPTRKGCMELASGSLCLSDVPTSLPYYSAPPSCTVPSVPYMAAFATLPLSCSFPSLPLSLSLSPIQDRVGHQRR